MIDWVPRKDHGGLKAVHAKSGELKCEFRSFKADVTNLVPPQKAGAIAANASLSDASGWCPVHAASMTSPIDSRVHILGDSSRANAMPKSAESAANQARLAARAIIRDLTGVDAPEHRIANTCWSLIADGDGVKVGATYRPEGVAFKATSNYVSVVGEHPSLRRRTYEESLGWYRYITSEMFGGA